jgi:hypothetical protein
MAAAVGIGVMRQHVRDFLFITFGAVVTPLGAGAFGARLVCRATVENAVRERRMILSADLPLGVIAGWKRNELAEAQLNKSEVLPY